MNLRWESLEELPPGRSYAQDSENQQLSPRAGEQRRREEGMTESSTFSATHQFPDQQGDRSTLLYALFMKWKEIRCWHSGHESGL